MWTTLLALSMTTIAAITLLEGFRPSHTPRVLATSALIAVEQRLLLPRSQYRPELMRRVDRLV